MPNAIIDFADRRKETEKQPRHNGANFAEAASPGFGKGKQKRGKETQK